MALRFVNYCHKREQRQIVKHKKHTAPYNSYLEVSLCDWFLLLVSHVFHYPFNLTGVICTVLIGFLPV